MLFARNGADDLVDPRRARPRPGRGRRRGARRARSTAARSRRSASGSTRTGTASLDGAGLVLAPAFVDPHVHLRTPGPRGRGDDRVRHRRGCGGRLLRDPRDAEHRAGRRLGGRARRADRDGAAPRPRSRSASSPRSRRARRATELTEMGELADAGAAGVHRRRPAGRLGRADAARAPVRAITGRRARAALRGADAVARRPHARGRRSRPSSASAASRRSRRALMVERDLALAAYEGRPLHLMHLSARESVDALERAHGRGLQATRRGDAAPPLPHRRGGALARPEREDEPAAARRRATARR